MEQGIIEHYHCSRCGKTLSIGAYSYGYFDRKGNPICSDCIIKIGLKTLKKQK